MTTLLQIKQELTDQWGDNPAYGTCVEIIDFVGRSWKHTNVITYRTLLNGLGRSELDANMMGALTILVSSRIHLLDMHAFFYDGNREFELSAEEWKLARHTGELSHPLSGNIVTDFSDNVVPFFVPSQRVFEGQ